MTTTTSRIPDAPEDIKYEAGGLNICLGLVIEPGFFRWVAVHEYIEADVYGDFGKELCKQYDLKYGPGASGGEYEIADSEGFGDLKPTSIEEALMLADLESRMAPEQWEALPQWVSNHGKHWTLYHSGTLQDARDVFRAFEDDYLGSFESEEKYAEERFAEFQDQLEALNEEMSQRIFSYMNWKRLAHDYEQDDVWYGESGTYGIPVFRKV